MSEAPDQSVIVDLLLALGLGLLVGFQRQAVHEPVAGIRTFALLTLFGCLCGLLVPALGVWIVPAGLLAVASLLVVTNAVPRVPPEPSNRHDRGDLGGLTTEVSAHASLSAAGSPAVRKSLERNGHGAMECRRDVHDAYNERIDRGNLGMAWGTPNVRSWYKNARGRVTQNCPFTLLEYWSRTRAPDPTDYRST